MTRQPRVAVLGASGYAGALTAFLLDRHSEFSLVRISSRSDAGRSLDEIYPRYRIELGLTTFEQIAEEDFDAVVVAYPHMAAAPAVRHFLERGAKVVDLSADFRLRDLTTYEEWYGAHPVPELIGEAVYGLPELYREQIAGARLVANPGCYPTATILALAPLARAGLIRDLVVDAKSGVSGAGRAATDATHFVSVDENVTPYGVPRHRHTPEIEQELSAAAGGQAIRMTFTPHLLPLDQGELVSCYVTLADPDVQESDLRAMYGDFYRDEGWVEMLHQRPGLRTSGRLPAVRDVRETNFCRISVHKDERTGRAIVFAAIDNLWKGTASQAVQNLNVMFGFEESEAL